MCFVLVVIRTPTQMATAFFKKILAAFKSHSDEPLITEPEAPEWSAKDPDFALDNNSLRFITIRESLHGHKSVIFDSQRFSSENQDSGYADEIKTLAEYMLGTIPLSGQVEALKVHFLNQNSVLWSLTFQQSHSLKSCSVNSSSTSFGSSNPDLFLFEADSGFFSPKPSSNSLSFNDNTSDLSLKRRWELSNPSISRSDSTLQIPTQGHGHRKVKVSVGLLLTLPQEKLEHFFEVLFIEELLQRLKIGLQNQLKGQAFLNHMYLLYCQTKEVMVTFMRTKRLHLTAWHLKNQYVDYLVFHLISLKKFLDTKEKKFFLCTWLTAFLTYNPTWAFSLVPPETEANVEEISIRKLMQNSGKSFFYNVGETQINDLCGGKAQIAKFILTSVNSGVLESLIFVTSYFLRCSVVRRRKLAMLPKITEDLLKPKKVTVRKKSEESDGVLFMLGENEKLVQNSIKKSGKKRESRGSLHYMKINLPSIPELPNETEEICPLPYGISISDRVLPGEILQGCITKDDIEETLAKDVRYHEGPKELMWIHGNLETGQTDIYSSLMQEKGDVVFAPLVADLVDNLEGLEPNLPSQNVLQLTEESLFRIYLVSKLMVALIKGSDKMLNLETMAKSLGVDRNDIPLLIAVASTHTPDLQLKLSLFNK